MDLSRKPQHFVVGHQRGKSLVQNLNLENRIFSENLSPLSPLAITFVVVLSH